MALVCPWSPFLAVAASLRQPLMQQPSAAQPRLLTALVPLVATTITVLLAVAALPQPGSDGHDSAARPGRPAAASSLQHARWCFRWRLPGAPPPPPALTGS